VRLSRELSCSQVVAARNSLPSTDLAHIGNSHIHGIVFVHLDKYLRSRDGFPGFAPNSFSQLLRRFCDVAMANC
jgi:hypothetical protein